jgi:hypothetical protein
MIFPEKLPPDQIPILVGIKLWLGLASGPEDLPLVGVPGFTGSIGIIEPVQEIFFGIGQKLVEIFGFETFPHEPGRGLRHHVGGHSSSKPFCPEVRRTCPC